MANGSNQQLDPNFEVVSPSDAPAPQPDAGQKPLDPNFEVVGDAVPRGPNDLDPNASTFGTGWRGAVQGVIGYPEAGIQALERSTGIYGPQALRDWAVRFKRQAESTNTGRAAEFATSVGATLPFREAGGPVGALAGAFNQPILNKPGKGEYALELAQRAALSSVPVLGLASAARQFRQQTAAEAERTRIAEQNRQGEQTINEQNKRDEEAYRQRYARFRGQQTRANRDYAAAAQQYQQARTQAAAEHAINLATHQTNVAQAAQQHAANVADYQRQVAQRAALPETITREQYANIYRGTGVTPPTTVHPTTLEAIRQDVGSRLSAARSQLTLNEASIPSVRRIFDDAMQNLPEAGQQQLADSYEEYVRSRMGSNLTGRPLSDFLSDLNGEAFRLTQRARGGGDKSDYAVAQRLRDMADTVAEEADGPQEAKDANKLWSGAYRRTMETYEAAPPQRRGLATAPGVIRAQVRREGPAYADPTRWTPEKQRLQDLAAQAATRPTSPGRPPKQPPKPVMRDVGPAPTKRDVGPAPGRAPPRPFTPQPIPKAPAQQPQSIPGTIANAATTLAVYHMWPWLGASHALWWLGRDALRHLANDPRLRRAIAAAGNRPAAISAAISQALQEAERYGLSASQLPNPSVSSFIPGGGSTT